MALRPTLAVRYSCCLQEGKPLLLCESARPWLFKRLPTLFHQHPLPDYTGNEDYWVSGIADKSTKPRPCAYSARLSAFFPHYLLANLVQAHLSPCWNCGNYTAVDFHASTNESFEAITNKTDIYSTNIFADVIVDIIDKHDASEPLFIYAPFEAVHGAASCYTDDVRLIFYKIASSMDTFMWLALLSRCSPLG